jgi:NADPH-dependent 2,4-dienoyl-CoA reductase/sulfur reductase-like enzyme
MFYPHGRNDEYAAEIKKHVKKSYVGTVGGLSDPYQMEEIIASGKADVIEMARSLIADPDLPVKMRTGREDDITPCMRCMSCFSAAVTSGIEYCSLNPEIGHLGDMRFMDAKAVRSKKVLVAGGGVGGMQAALNCAQYGHSVILFEEKSELGGALNCERNVPFKKKLDMYIETQKRRLIRAGVEVRLNTALTPEIAESLKPDVIIAATGAVPLKPDIPGIEGANVLEAQEAYRNPEKAGSAVVIIGAGLAGLELGVYLSMLGRKVSVVEMSDKVNDGGNFLHMQGLWVELRSRGIEVFLNTKAQEVRQDGLLCMSAGSEGSAGSESKESFFAADTIIYAAGQTPRRADALALNYCAPEFYMLGDCVMPGNITDATGSAYDTALNIGRF